jgi:hypothetical protein
MARSTFAAGAIAPFSEASTGQARKLEAGVGIEPAYTDLQSAAWPLCHPAETVGDPGTLAEVCTGKQKGKPAGLPLEILERETSLELATSTLARLRSTN